MRQDMEHSQQAAYKRSADAEAKSFHETDVEFWLKEILKHLKLARSSFVRRSAKRFT